MAVREAAFVKGFIVAGVFEFLEKQFDEQVVQDLMDKHEMPVGGFYHPAADYPDITLFQLIECAAEVLDMPSSKLSKILGVALFAELALLNPCWVAQSKNTFDLLKSYNFHINKMLEEAFPRYVSTSFNCVEITPDILEVNYTSPFLPVDVVEGLIAAGSNHFNESFSVQLIKYDLPVDFNLRFILRRKSDSRLETI